MLNPILLRVKEPLNPNPQAALQPNLKIKPKQPSTLLLLLLILLLLLLLLVCYSYYCYCDYTSDDFLR